MSDWTQPICERCWIEKNSTWEGGQRLISIRRPTRLKDPEVERCSYCGLPTIFGAYVRDDPNAVAFPPGDRRE